jgi:Flp pilus assembly pilin Flp
MGKKLGSGDWRKEDGQDVAEYAIMLAVLLVIALSATALIGTSSNQVFSSIAQAIAQL